MLFVYADAGRMAGGRMSVYVKKFEILQNETDNSTMLSDCVPVIMDLITCDLNVDTVLRQSLLRSLVQSQFSYYVYKFYKIGGQKRSFFFDGIEGGRTQNDQLDRTNVEYRLLQCILHVKKKHLYEFVMTVM